MGGPEPDTRLWPAGRRLLGLVGDVGGRGPGLLAAWRRSISKEEDATQTPVYAASPLTAGPQHWPDGLGRLGTLLSVVYRCSWSARYRLVFGSRWSHGAAQAAAMVTKRTSSVAPPDSFTVGQQKDRIDSVLDW